MGSSTVVVANVLGEHETQMLLAEDQHGVSLSSARRVRRNLSENSSPRTTRGNPDHLDAHVGENSMERRGELTGPISDQIPETE